jgi:transcriptional regulator with XRE-family HTH domain
MSAMEAVGGYLEAHRKQRGLSRVEVAARIGTNEPQVLRIEQGKIDTRSSLLARFAHVVGGDMRVVQRLLLDEGATREDGLRLAQQALEGTAQDARDGAPDGSAGQHSDELDRILADLEDEVRRTPGQLGVEMLRLFLSGLRAQRGGGSDEPTTPRG